MGKILTAALLTVLLLAAAGVAYMYSGVYNVAASEPHSALSAWMLKTTKRNSVQAHAPKTGAPGEVSPERLRQGASHYADTCAKCHGAPGVERGAVGKGLTPSPPDLARAIAEWSDTEAFWIVKHGIKFTGMPAFGKSHGDEELWSIVAFVRQLPRMSPERYRETTGAQEQPTAAPSGEAQGAADAAKGGEAAESKDGQSKHGH